MSDNFIDSIAAIRKFGIENSGRTRDEKEWEKSGVDCIASILKLLQAHPKQNVTVMGLDIELIRGIKKVAEEYSIEKVVLFPYPNGQNVVPIVRVYGGDQKQFFQRLGWKPSGLKYSTEHDRLIEEFGMILYQKV